MTRRATTARIVFTLSAMLLCANVLLRAQFGGADLNGAAKLMQFTGQISVHARTAICGR